MVNKQGHPEIKPKDWLNVEGADCVVTQVYNAFAISGACEVVTDPENPINRDVGWDGEKWVFSPRPTLVNAARTARLKEYVELLQRGR